MALDLHQRLALVLIFLGVVGAGWALFEFRRTGSISGGLRVFLLLTFGLVLVQDAAGLLLLSQGHRPANFLLHIMYGVLSTVVLPLAWGMSARSSARGEALFLGFGSLLFALLTFRATLVA